MSTKPVLVPSSDATVSRRGFLMKLGILFNGFAAMVLAVPVVGFLLSSVTRGCASAYLSWVPLGPVSDFPEGETRLATFRNPYVMPTDGKTVDTACWVRRIAGDQFQVFAINCAHLGCPVRWFQQSGLFMCPCHGGAYYRDGKDLELIASNTPDPAGSVHRLAICGHHVWIPKSSEPRFALREVAYRPEWHPREIAARTTARNRRKTKSHDGHG